MSLVREGLEHRSVESGAASASPHSGRTANPLAAQGPAGARATAAAPAPPQPGLSEGHNGDEWLAPPASFVMKSTASRSAFSPSQVRRRRALGESVSRPRALKLGILSKRQLPHAP